MGKGDYRSGGSGGDSGDNILHNEVGGKNFASIDELRGDIERNYIGAGVGKIHNDGYRVTVGNNDGKYRVASVGNGTPESIWERLTMRKKTKLIYLILEETDG